MAGPSRADRADDAALLAGLALEDPAVSAAFVRRFQGAVYGLAVAITRDPGLAQDVSQEVFVRSWRAADTYDPRRASVLTWLLTITRNAAIDAVRARRATPTDDEVLGQLVQDALSVPDLAETAQLRLETSRAVRRLHDVSPEQARAVVLAVLAGCTAADVAQREGIPLGTAKTRIRTGLRRLREDAAALQREGERDR
ncbi:sigma-70 family RNA polymerase sigma factor [Ornithinicoccus hortensis]|uniref:RNA polymerase sigma-70 factor (ECF subfamily) n=1 Tax=Ornithinicoccus hortensis TaxID=82346 RepID=A0A542YLZ1_9MICO|nr:sigma-70 family RNA polymerase sigma factor [Ornithinicoccus hortensis]TQL49097.1 RNA polymerase sigma-70 factor (ECF subfamily) [Ornithinicoccus hortensis]